MSDAYAFVNRKINYDSEQLTVSTTMVSLTASKYNNTSSLLIPRKASVAIIQALANDIYYTLDGSTPSASNGKRLLANTELGVAGYNRIKNFRCIRVSADGAIHVDYYA
jgi:hypothetical protein